VHWDSEVLAECAWKAHFWISGLAIVYGALLLVVNGLATRQKKRKEKKIKGKERNRK